MKRPTPHWLLDAVIYQIYPQSFYDSNGDGIGDLPGVIAKLDYVQSLGVSAIWLSPFFTSPFNDAGYDIADYYQVAPRYGTNDDFRRLCQEAHARGLRVLFDLVIGHCSWENPWFITSCQGKDNPYSDWFIWSDSVWMPAPPGLEMVRGYAPRMGGYLTNFFVSQPAFNFGFAHPDPRYPWQQGVDAPGPRAVRNELKKIIQFWFEQGADGLRADMALSLVKGDLDGKATGAVWAEIREWIDREYPEHIMVAEGGNPSVAVGLGGFHIDFCLPWRMPAYNSLFRRNTTHEGGGTAGVDPHGFSVFEGLGHGNIREFMDEYIRHYERIKDLGFISIPAGNHDLHPRISFGRSPAEILQAFLFTYTMPGVPFLYYGDEIGMRTIDGLPSVEGSYDRSGIRTPMQWDASPNAGFSNIAAGDAVETFHWNVSDAPAGDASAGRLYLPIDPDPGRPTVQAQQDDPASLLNQTKALIAARRSLRALQADAAFEVLYAERGRMPIVYLREKDGERLVIAVNPTLNPCSALVTLPGTAEPPQTVWGYPDAIQLSSDGWQVSLPPASGGIYRFNR